MKFAINFIFRHNWNNNWFFKFELDGIRRQNGCCCADTDHSGGFGHLLHQRHWIAHEIRNSQFIRLPAAAAAAADEWRCPALSADVDDHHVDGSAFGHGQHVQHGAFRIACAQQFSYLVLIIHIFFCLIEKKKNIFIHSLIFSKFFI